MNFSVSIWVFTCLLSIDVAANSFVQTETNRVKVVSSVWQGFTELDGSGIYFNLLKEVYRDSKFELVLNASEFQRALNLFKGGKADIMVGVLKHEVPNGHFPKWILDTDLPIVGFHLKSKKIQMPKLDQQRIGWMGMYAMAQFFPNLKQPYLFKSRDAAFNMLVANRLDVFLDYAHNANQTFQDRLTYTVIRDSEALYLVFQPTYKGRILAKIYDKQMVKIREEGRLEQIFGESYQRSGLIEFEVKP